MPSVHMGGTSERVPQIVLHSVRNCEHFNLSVLMWILFKENINPLFLILPDLYQSFHHVYN